MQCDDELDERVEDDAGRAAAAAAATHEAGEEDRENEPPPRPRYSSDPPDGPRVLQTDTWEDSGRPPVPPVDGPVAVHAPAGLEGELPPQSFFADQGGRDVAGGREGRQEEERRQYVHCVVVNTREQHSPVFMQRRELYEQVLRLEGCGVQVRKKGIGIG